MADSYSILGCYRLFSERCFIIHYDDLLFWVVITYLEYLCTCLLSPLGTLPLIHCLMVLCFFNQFFLLFLLVVEILYILDMSWIYVYNIILFFSIDVLYKWQYICHVDWWLADSYVFMVKYLVQVRLINRLWRYFQPYFFQ